MLSIGEFAMISGISKKTLRYYDEIGLLEPENVDKDNQYRWYSKNQVERAKKICEYKSTGMSLKTIKQLIDSFESNLEKRYIIERMREIEEEIIQLDKQKRTARLILQKNDGLIIDSEKLVVKETVLAEGKWFIMEVEEEIDEIDSRISDFYEETSKKGLQLKSAHMIKVSEDSRSIVARVEERNEENGVKIPTRKSIVLENLDMNTRNVGYLKLIEYGKDRNYVLDYFLESYVMNNGKFSLSIQAICK